MRHRLFFAALLVGLALPLPAVQGAGVSLELVGELPLTERDLVISDEVGKRLMVLTPGDPGMQFVLIDPVSGRELARHRLPWFLPSASSGNPRAYAWDEAGRRLFLAVYDTQHMTLTRTDPMLVTLSPEGAVLAARRMVQPFPPGIGPTGMSWSPPDRRLYLVGQGADSGLVGNYAVFVNALDPESATSMWPEGARLVDSCQKTVGFARQAAIVRNPVNGRLFLGCGTGNLLASPEPGLPAVAEVDITDPARPVTTLHPVAGSYAGGESMYDYAGHKFVMVSQGPNQPVQAAWIFDEIHGTFTGVVSAGRINVFLAALDGASGHLFVGIDNHLLIGSTRLRKTPQAFRVSTPGITGNGPGVVALRHAGLLLVPQYLDNAYRFRLYRATLPEFAPPADEDPDAATLDAAEVPGRVGADFGGDVQAFGVRVHEVAGANGVLQSTFPSSTDYVTFINSPFQLVPKESPVPPPQLRDGSRDVYLARVTKGHLSHDEASASAVAADGDATSRADYTMVTGADWPASPATCSDFRGSAQRGTQDGVDVECDQAGSRVAAKAAYDRASALPGLFSVGSAYATSTMERPAGKPLVLRSQAEARDVNIGPVHLGRISSESVAQVAGRRGTAAASYVRSFEDVSMPGMSCSASCDEEAVVKQMNVVLGAKFRAELPAASVVGTPGGAHADASRDPWHHQQDVVLNDQAESEQQVAALRVTWLNDNAQRSRVVFEFGATDATAGYRLFALGGEGGGLDSVFAGSTFGAGEGSAGIGSGGAQSTVGEGPASELAGPARAGGGGGGLLRRLGRGLALALLGRDHTVLNALLWALLATPVFLAARRRYLLRLVA